MHGNETRISRIYKEVVYETHSKKKIVYDAVIPRNTQKGIVVIKFVLSVSSQTEHFFFLQRGIVDTKSKVSYRFMNDCVSLSGLTKDSSIDYSPTI